MKTTLLFLLLLLFTFSAKATLIGFWREDETAGNLIDDTGLNPEGARTGTAQYAELGVPNGLHGSIHVTNAQGTSIAYGPSSVDSHFVVGSDNNNPVMNVAASGKLTVMGWILPRAPENPLIQKYQIIGTGSSTNPDFGWGFGLRFDVLNGITEQYVSFTNYGVGEKRALIPFSGFDEWIHIAATYDGGVTTLYWKGLNLLTHADTRPFGDDSTNNRLVIGGRLGGADRDQTFGNLDGIRVYDSVLTEQEIRVAAAESVSAIPEANVAALVLCGIPLVLRARRRG